MKKVGLILAGATGFVLGSRSGRKPYESLEAKARELAGRPRVQAAKDAVGDVVGATLDVATEKAGVAKSVVEEKLGVTPPEDGADRADGADEADGAP